MSPVFLPKAQKPHSDTSLRFFSFFFFVSSVGVFACRLPVARVRVAPKMPMPLDDLTGFTGEMRLVEMACLTALSSGAGKSAGLIMHEQVPSSLLPQLAPCLMPLMDSRLN